jgi:hypothetical protein
MKRYLIVLSVLLFGVKAFSQGMIQGFTVSPANPTTSDIVTIYVDLQFSSMGCDVVNQGHSTTGASTDAYAHHCLGMLSAICDHTDTFNLGYLPAGLHLFRMTLTSGFGGPPCSPGIVPDDTDTISFNVLTSVGINEKKNDLSLSVFPNPFNTEATLVLSASVQSGNIRIFDILGKQVRNFSFSGNEIILKKEDLENGIYFIQVTSEEKLVISERIIIQ